MSHVRSSVVRRMEEYVKKLVFVDSSAFFDRVVELSGPVSEQRTSAVYRALARIAGSVINLPQYFALLEFDLMKGITTATKYLELFRRSLETSVTFSSLLTGVLTTVAMLALAVLRGVP